MGNLLHGDYDLYDRAQEVGLPNNILVHLHRNIARTIARRQVGAAAAGEPADL